MPVTRPRVYKMGDPGIPADAVYIGRPSPWENPYPIKTGVRTRKQAIEQFRKYLRDNPELVRRAQRELIGKCVVCFCHPKPCHGDIWLELVNPRPSLFSSLIKESK